MTRPKIVLTLLVRDEEDIVGSNMRFHLERGVDFVIATDNLSEDGTGEILREYERAGALLYLRETEDNYDQSRWVTAMARLACERYQADWVINADADEFWWPESGDLRDIPGAAPADALKADRTNFVPRPMEAGRRFADGMTIRERDSRNPLGGPLPGKVCHRAYPDIAIAQGNHAAYRNGVELEAESAPITILHFPMRTYRQFENKIAKGGAAYARNAHLPQATGSTWRKLYEIWRQGGLPDYYAARVPGDAAVEAGLRDGTFVVDERLKIALERVPE